jgi:hypothetical protein
LKKTLHLLFSMLFTNILILSGCNLPLRTQLVRSVPGLVLRLDSPSNGEVFKLSQEIFLQVTAQTSQYLPIVRYAFFANGELIAFDLGQDLGNSLGRGRWHPSRPGEYLIQTSVTLRDGSVAVTEASRICVLPDTFTGMLAEGLYFGPCDEYPTVTSTFTPTITATGTPYCGWNRFGNFYGYYDCTSTPTITITPTAFPPILHPVVVMTFTPTNTSTLTPTPASAEDCLPGTYFSPATFRCIDIQASTPKPKNNGGASSQCPAGQTYVCSGIAHQTCGCK